MGQIQISQLLLKIKDGEYVLPDFQRGFVWNKTKVKKLISSLYHNYPTGTLLIWSTKRNVKLRGNTVSNEGVYTKLILDGQQRLTGIYTILTGEEPPFYEGKDLDFNLYFDLDSEEFSYWQPVKMKDSYSWINVTDFFKKGDAGKYLGEIINSDDEERKSHFTSNFQKYFLYNYKINRKKWEITYETLIVADLEKLEQLNHSLKRTHNKCFERFS